MNRLALAALFLAAALFFAGLGVWQVDRRAWKLDLIARTEAHLRAAPVAPPRRSVGQRDLFLRVRASGRFLHDRETLVQAVTERGPGWWVMTPLATAHGLLLVNRGFVPQDRADPRTRAKGQVPGVVPVTGLLRLSEPGGAFLRSNDPAANRWFSRDVAVIARARRLGPVLPYFVDADATPNPGGFPVGGLTVTTFRNAHLVYAITWFALAGLSVAGLVLVLSRPRPADAGGSA